jgi:membrane protein
MRRSAQRVFDFYWGTGIADDVPALTYYLLLSLAPFALGLAAMQALLLDNVLSAIEVSDQLNRFLPDAVHADIQQLVLGTRSNSPLLLALAVVTMLWTTSGAIGVVERCESRMLDAPRHGIVAGRIRNMLLGAGVAVMFAAASAGAPVIGDAADTLNLRGALPGGLLFVVNTIGSIAVFTGIYRWAPRAHLRWRSAAVGAIPAGIAIQVVPALVGLYVGQFVGFAAVRLFLTLAVVLLGLYVMATVILVGSGLAVKREVRHLKRVIAGGRPVPERFGPSYRRRGREDGERPGERGAEPEAERPRAPTGA